MLFALIEFKEQIQSKKRKRELLRHIALKHGPCLESTEERYVSVDKPSHALGWLTPASSSKLFKLALFIIIIDMDL